MHRASLLAIAAVAAVTLAGCPKKPTGGECKTSEDCLAQQGVGKVCVEGRCQECAADGDCQDGFVCRENKCVPKAQCATDADCPGLQTCESGKCVPRAGGAAEQPDPSRRAGAVPPECADPGAFTIRFGFDQANLSPEAQGSLQKLAECLKTAPAAKVVVAGHADERGTTQYNIALGARRAEAARKYLSDLGAAKLDTVSFGEEKPVCDQTTEDCWARNRRAEFQVDR